MMNCQSPSPLGEGSVGGIFLFYSPKSRYTPISLTVSLEMRLFPTITSNPGIFPFGSLLNIGKYFHMNVFLFPHS